jgi:hypothetical protein
MGFLGRVVNFSYIRIVNLDLEHVMKETLIVLGIALGATALTVALIFSGYALSGG